jgi:predicted nucleic acid-binding protein
VIVLDTNVVSELMRGRPHARVIEWVDSHDGLAITAITAAELLHGVRRLPDGARKAALDAAVRDVIYRDFADRVLPFDTAAAEQYAEITTDRERLRRPVSAADAQIAAICRARGAGLATRNVRDFDRTGIEVFDPWSAS